VDCGLERSRCRGGAGELRRRGRVQQPTGPGDRRRSDGQGEERLEIVLERGAGAGAFKELDHSTDSGKSYEAIPSVGEAYALGFGKPAEGKTYPALYLIGKIDGVTGYFRSDDKGETWVRINDDMHQWGFCTVIIGDPRVSGRVYIGTGGRGIIYGEPK